MISHTVRVFKLMYIVAGILISNAEICDTVDRIQIAPRVEMKPDLIRRATGKGQGEILKKRGVIESDGSPSSKRRRKLSVTSLAGDMVRGVTSKVTSKVTSQVTSRMGNQLNWLSKARLILQQWRTLALSFTVWTIPNLLVEYTSNYIGKKFFLNRDCDMIYK